MPTPILDLLTEWLSESKIKVPLVRSLRTTFRTARILICGKVAASMFSSLVASDGTSTIDAKGRFCVEGVRCIIWQQHPRISCSQKESCSHRQVKCACIHRWIRFHISSGYVGRTSKFLRAASHWRAQFYTGEQHASLASCKSDIPCDHNRP
jgi:hypothetical protein